MDDRLAADQSDVVGEYVGTVTAYRPRAHVATVKLRVPVRAGSHLLFWNEGNECRESLRALRGVRRRFIPAGEDILVKVHQPIEAGAEIFRLWQ